MDLFPNVFFLQTLKTDIFYLFTIGYVRKERLNRLRAITKLNSLEAK